MIQGRTGAGATRRLVLRSAALAGGALAAPAFLRSASAQAGTVHFGGSLPLTGTYEKVAKIYRDGYDFWSRTVGGKITVAGRPVEVKWTIYDDENNASRVAQLTEKLFSDNKINCLVGAYGTDTVLAQGAIAGRHNRALIQAGAASARVDEEIGGKTCFTLVGGARNYYKLAIDYLAAMKPAPKTIAIVVVDDPVYQEHVLGIKERCAAAGIKVVLEDTVPLNVQDLRPTALKMRRLGDVDIICSPAWDLICIKLVEELSTLGAQPNAFIGGHLTTNPVVKQSLGAKLRDVIGVTLWTPALKYKDPYFASPADFATKFQATYGYAPTYHAAMSYSIPLLYETVLKDADPADPYDQDAIKKKLLALRTETVWGPIAFNAKGRIERDGMPVIQWLGDGPDPKVVFPAELVESPGVYPKRAW